MEVEVSVANMRNGYSEFYLLYARPLIKPDHCVSHSNKTQRAHSHVWSGTKKYTTYIAIFPFREDFSPGRFSQLSFFLH